MAAWTRDDDKAFETALTLVLPFNDSDEDAKKWEELAAKVPGKSLEEVKAHYEALVEDIQAIEAGKVALPVYVGGEKEREREREREKEREREGLQQHSGGGGEKKGGGFGGFEAGGGKSVSKAEQERRKGIPWTEEEHKLFLLGLDKFGKGDWRSISRNFVISRTPTQVASHAQKYFIRLNSMNRDRRRASIHDITSVNNGDVASPHVPITGQVNPAMAAPVKHHPHHPHHPHHHPTGMPAMGMYGPPAMGHPAAVGTPVMRPPGHPPYVIPVAYPVPPTMHP